MQNNFFLKILKNHRLRKFESLFLNIKRWKGFILLSFKNFFINLLICTFIFFFFLQKSSFYEYLPTYVIFFFHYKNKTKDKWYYQTNVRLTGSRNHSKSTHVINCSIYCQKWLFSTPSNRRLYLITKYYVASISLLHFLFVTFLNQQKIPKSYHIGWFYQNEV